MVFIQKKMDKQTALQILGWKYEKPYDFYNNEVSEGSLSELLDGSYIAVFEDGSLFGFLCAGQVAQVPKGVLAGVYPEGFIDIGIGMHPEGTGQGQGRRFFGHAMSVVQERYPDLRMRLTVAEFNKRAIHLYKQFGFAEAGRFSTDSAEFMTMEKRR
ncbi:GNAT family N-acetyltransferase [Planococcus sp. FY231025]|uniref:GNAT family N-acetyltransferase n=1 Tax=Planococcus sp. FY231025 TaxID=3455699 RepID=UPI003F93E2A1